MSNHFMFLNFFKVDLLRKELLKVFSFLFFILIVSFLSNVFGQNATEDFDPTVHVFGGGVSGTNWANNDWIRSGANGNATDVQAIDPSDFDENIGGDLLQLKDNVAGLYRIIDLSVATAAILSFDFDYDNDKEGNETLLIQIDQENYGAYVTLQTITATTTSPNPEINFNISIPAGSLGGANT